MININAPITGKQIGIWFIGVVATIATIVVLTYTISWAWHKGQQTK